METLTYRQARENNSNEIQNAISQHDVFFAFSNEQFAEGKNKLNLKEGDTIVKFGYGGYMPKSKATDLKNALEVINTNYRQLIKDNNFQEDEILYELCNHECFYTYEIDSVVDIFEGIYTTEEIRKVFYKNVEEYA